MTKVLIFTPFYTLNNKKDLFQDTKAVEYLVNNTTHSFDIDIIHTFIFSYKNIFKFLKYYKRSLNNNILEKDSHNNILFLPTLIPFPRGYKLLSIISKRHVNIIKKTYNIDSVICLYHLPTYYMDYVDSIHSKKIAIVHSYDISIIKRKKTIEFWKEYFEKFDEIAFRSPVIEKEFRAIFNKKFNFNSIVFSGIPKKIIDYKNVDKINKSPIRITFVGRIDKNKNLELVIKALNQISNRDFIFTIIGDGPKRKEVESMAKEYLSQKVIFKGKLDRENTMFELQNSDVFVMLSKKETFGLVYLEALAKNNIVLATKNQGIDGYIIDGHNGFLVDINNIKKVSKKIENILNLNKHDQIKIRKNGHELIKTLTDEKASQNYYDLIIRNL